MSIVEHRRFSVSTQRLITPVIFTLTIFLSASLLFFVQPLFAKLVLPKIGGAPGVWTTAMLFFQVVLLAGYIYAHFLTRYVPARWQLPVHLVFWGLALLFLPLSVSPSWTFDPTASLAWQTLLLFAAGVGVPFAMLSANAPLLQSWYARSGGPSADDPYFLYGASNFGSLLALVAFPFIAGPLLGIAQIGWAWAAGFALFGGFLALSGFLSRGAAASIATVAVARNVSEEKVNPSEVGKWLFLAFVPSSLMLSITTKVSSDLGSFPLIWVIPLALYILSFVVAFTNRQFLSRRVSRYLAIASVAALAVLMSQWVGGHLSWIGAILYAPALFFISVEAHRSLYESRPGVHNLTVFYITMSVGGALGGLFNSILAPTLFNEIYEGQISVLLAAFLLLAAGYRFASRAVALGVLIAAIVLIPFMLADGVLSNSMPMPAALVLMAVFALMLIRFEKTPLVIASAISVFIGVEFFTEKGEYLFRDRSFFGTHKVFEADGIRTYGNGTTVHGYQFVEEAGARPTPLSYYYPESPMAQVLTSERGRQSRDIGIVGLGVGSLACYAQPGQNWEFYEIDAMVDRVARDTSLFSFMSQCAPESETRLGDARIVLEQQDVTFDILVLDAYSSDAIPIHLVTQEAVELYQKRLKNDGLLVFHISNRYFDLSQPLARIAGSLGLSAAIRYDLPAAGESLPRGARASIVLVMSPDRGRIQELLDDTRWQAIVSDGAPVWTDDSADPLSALK